MERYVVIGAGHAGGRAVEAMRMAGFDGEIVLVGEEPHLPYERPPLSKELLRAKQGYSFPHIRPQDYFAEQRIDLRLGTPAVGLDTAERAVHLADGATVSYDKLLLTTGGIVRRLSVPGADHAKVLYLRTLDDAAAIDAQLGEGRRVVVIGGGFIGLEVAASARHRGAAVTVVELADRLMNRGVPPVVSDHFLALHRRRGAEIRLATGVSSISGASDGVEVVTDAGDSLHADLVVVGVGIAPAVALAQSAGIHVNDGIVVDEFCRTSAPGVFAAGDVAYHFNPALGRHVRLEAWQCAQNMAIAAARIMCGGAEPYAEVPWMWSDQYDSNLQIAGVPANWDDLVIRGDPASGSFIGFVLDDGRIDGAVAVNQPRDMRLARRMISDRKSVTAAELQNESVSMRDLAKR